MEIERKFTLKELPADLESYPCHVIEQAYLNTSPVIRIRKEDDHYYMTYKGKGLLAKTDGNIISKKRYVIPIEAPQFTEDYVPLTDIKLVIELDVFAPPFAPLIMAEVEFPDIDTANAFLAPEWFDQDVTSDPAYHNSNMSSRVFE